YGREELLWETLVVIQSGVPFNDECRKRLDRIPWNRAKKHRRLGLHLRRRRSAEWEAIGPGRRLGRQSLSGENHTEVIRANQDGAGVTCRTCGKAMTPAEEAAYRSRCEDCWAEKAVGVEVDESGAQVQGISVEHVQGMLTPGEWAVECRLAAGQTYPEVA